MKINAATAYQHQTILLDRIRTEAAGYKKMTVHVSNLRPGDLLTETGQVVRQTFDHIYDPTGEVEFGPLGHRVLVHFTQVHGLSVVTGNDDGCVNIFRPIQPEEA